MLEVKKNNPFPWIIIGAAIGIFIKLFVIDILHIAGTSMEPALHEGSTVFVNKLAYGLVKPGSRRFFIQWAEPEPGDIVIYLHDNKIVVKRCVAVSNTRLDYLKNPEYTLIVRDLKIALSEEQYNRMKSNTMVTDGYILAVGDNYTESIDSRMYGFVSVKNVIGKVIGR
jgi:signal peptidase I